MSDTVTIYSELIEKIVNGTFSQKVLETRGKIVLKTILNEIETITDADTSSTPTKIGINLLMYLDTDSEETVETVRELPQAYQTYFFNEENLAMELINNFVLKANKAFLENKIQASITTAKVAARLRAQFLHYLTSADFAKYRMDLIAVNNGIITLSVDEPDVTLKQLREDI